MRDDVNRLRLGSCREVLQKPSQVCSRPIRIVRIDAVRQESGFRWPAVQHRCPVKLEVVRDLGRSEHGVFERDVVSMVDNLQRTGRRAFVCYARIQLIESRAESSNVESRCQGPS